MRAAGWAVGLSVGAVAFWAIRDPRLASPVTWARQVRPGVLSSAHTFLADNCAACHTPVKGATADKCVACHADSRVVQREPTAFHASVSTCRGCHPEHRGETARPTQMDHAVLARASGAAAAGQGLVRRGPGALLLAAGRGPAADRLECVTCHAAEDRHRTLFGRDCGGCHRTAGWPVPGYRHPSPRSTECAECHQAPPSHYMEHFRMVSATAARQPFATVRQCFHCHQTTAWNDIAGVGWYKHH